MEPPAVTSCSHLSGVSTSTSIDKLRRIAAERSGNKPASVQPRDFQLQIEPALTYAAPSNRVFEELPENFMEGISPEQGQEQMQQLAALAPMGVGSNDRSLFGCSGYVAMVPMTSSQTYVATIKVESMCDQIHHQPVLNRGARLSCIDKLAFSSGPANLLSPLNSNRSDNAAICESLIGVQQNGGRANALENRRPLQYIKEEVALQEYKDLGSNFLSHHMQQSTNLMTEDERQQELDHRLANAETPPAVSNVELASSYIAAMIGEQPRSPISQQQVFRTSSSTFRHQTGHETASSDDVEGNSVASTSADHSGSLNDSSDLNCSKLKNMMDPTLTYSTKNANDPLNAEIDDNIYIDTRDLCRRIAWELKQHSIPQAIFAERILCRSQGTLSDLLRNPKPWNKLKSGRETFRRMFNWVQQPLDLRLQILDVIKGEGDANYAGISNQRGMLSDKQLLSSDTVQPMSPPTPAQNARQGSRHKSRDAENGGDAHGSSTKRPRLVFTDIQKRTLQAIFKETQRPSREMQQTIGDHLQLDLSTVANFFMNARRRSRSSPMIGDSPAPYQQVRPITPPPESPPHQQRGQARIRGTRHAVRGHGNGNSIAYPSTESIVTVIPEDALKFMRKRDVSNLQSSCLAPAVSIDQRRSMPETVLASIKDVQLPETSCGTLNDEGLSRAQSRIMPIGFYCNAVAIKHEPEENCALETSTD